MKGWIFLFIILNSSLVLAQEITLFGQSYSIIVLMPLVLLAIGILFFILIYIKDNLPDIIKIFPKARIKIKKKKVEEEKEFIDYRLEVKNFKSRIKDLNIDEGFNQFSGLVRDFFSYTFDINRQFTYDELKDHIKKGQEVILPFSQKLEHIKYSGREISRNELNKLINEFEFIVGRYSKKKRLEIGLFDRIKNKLSLKIRLGLRILSQEIKGEYIINKIRFFKSLRIFKKKIEPKIEIKGKEIKKIKIKEEIWPEIEFKKGIFNFKILLDKIKLMNKVRKLSYIIKRCYRLIKLNPEKARILYSSILELYYQIPIDYEERFASTLSDLNNKIEESIRIKEENELNQLTKRMVDIVTSKKKTVVIHKEMPFFKNKLDNLIYNLRSLRIESRKEARELDKYFTDRFLDFLYEVKKLETKGIKKAKIVGRSIVDELEDLINNIKKAERQGIEVVRKEEENFIEGIKDILHNLRELEHRENKFLKKKEYILENRIRYLLKKLEKEEKEKILEIRQKEEGILNNIHKLMEHKKPKIELTPRKPAIKEEEITSPEVKEYEIEEFKPIVIKPKITKLPKMESKIKVEVSKATKDYKLLDKEEKDLFKKLIKVENEPEYVKYKYPIIRFRKKKHIDLEHLEIKSRINKEIKNLNKEEQELHKKLIEVS